MSKQKRVNFPWMKTELGRSYKTMLALLADKYKFRKVISGQITYNKYLKRIIKKTNKIFPNMFSVVQKHYQEKGRTITPKEFVPIAMGRLTMMFKYDKDKKKVVKLPEHPEKCSKLNDSIKQCEKILNAAKAE